MLASLENELYVSEVRERETLSYYTLKKENSFGTVQYNNSI